MRGYPRTVAAQSTEICLAPDVMVVIIMTVIVESKTVNAKHLIKVADDEVSPTGFGKPIYIAFDAIEYRLSSLSPTLPLPLLPSP